MLRLVGANYGFACSGVRRTGVPYFTLGRHAVLEHMMENAVAWLDEVITNNGISGKALKRFDWLPMTSPGRGADAEWM